MSLNVPWSTQVLSEISCAVKQKEDILTSEVVLSLMDFMYSMEYEACEERDVVLEQVSHILPKEWHVMIKEAAKRKERNRQYL